MGRGYREQLDDSSERLLVLIRHAKSDWSYSVSDQERPLATRGTRQATETGRWIADHVDGLDRAIVSPAQRAWSTWDLIGQQLPHPPGVIVEDAAYTFDGRDLLALVRRFPADWSTVALVGHNPAMEELVTALTGADVAMPTSCVAVIGWDGAWSDAGPSGTLIAHGRPVQLVGDGRPSADRPQPTQP